HLCNFVLEWFQYLYRYIFSIAHIDVLFGHTNFDERTSVFVAAPPERRVALCLTRMRSGIMTVSVQHFRVQHRGRRNSSRTKPHQTTAKPLHPQLIHIHTNNRWRDEIYLWSELNISEGLCFIHSFLSAVNPPYSGHFIKVRITLCELSDKTIVTKVEGFGLVCLDVYDPQFDHRALCFWIYTSALQVSAKSGFDDPFQSISHSNIDRREQSKREETVCHLHQLNGRKCENNEDFMPDASIPRDSTQPDSHSEETNPRPVQINPVLFVVLVNIFVLDRLLDPSPPETTFRGQLPSGECSRSQALSFGSFSEIEPDLKATALKTTCLCFARLNFTPFRGRSPQGEVM
ncbi:hypothetical protein IRJ41_014451, partial [Triplophysa rosa]